MVKFTVRKLRLKNNLILKLQEGALLYKTDFNFQKGEPNTGSPFLLRLIFLQILAIHSVNAVFIIKEP